MALGADIFIGAAIPPDTIRTAAAHAFGVPVDRVAYHEVSDAPWPDADVVLEVWDDTLRPGDYPLQILPWGPADRTNDSDTLTAFSVALGVPVLTAADSFDPTDQELYLPDRSMYRVSVSQGEDRGIRNTTIMRRLIEQHARSSAIAS